MSLKLSAAVVIKNDEEEILLVMQSSEKGESAGQWGPPAGHKEDRDPSVMATAIREAKEEAGVDVLLELSEGLYLSGPAHPIGMFKGPDTWGFVFKAIIADTQKHPLAGDVVKTSWFNEEEIHTLFTNDRLYRPGINLPFLVSRLSVEEKNFLLAEHAKKNIKIYPSLD
ncbi:MAG: NUDIX hydrolase [bacterium]|nr:NUDIX hydrolase [bacterium]